MPLPRPRPPPWAEPHSFAEAAGPVFNTADVTSAPTDCDERLAAIATIKPLPWLIGPESCGGRDMVELDAVALANHRWVAVKPAAILRCAMAESFAAWVRDEVSGRISMLGAALRGVENYDSYECRSRNRVLGAKLSEHAKGNAIDVRALMLADGRRLELTDATVAKTLREELQESPAIVSPRYWGLAPTVITMATSISTSLSAVAALVFANGMCASRLRRRPKLQAHMFS